MGLLSEIFDVFVFGENAKLLGRYKTKVLPIFGDNMPADFLFKGSPNYIVHKRVLLPGYADKINVFVMQVLDIDKISNREKRKALLEFI